ncbi:RHO4 protein [Rhodotorula toruloides]|uniref:Small ras-like GTPase, rho family n=1 Tax=Rhodotorula toruloides TaxID=5286 RepID=A0A2T0A6C7_RHOTO|nr:GTP-binding protein RHO1 [Rhodotorula toruloides]PRQ73568.1 small ras-like GTPase, rho family [Rhodotorula toruloides]
MNRQLDYHAHAEPSLGSPAHSYGTPSTTYTHGSTASQASQPLPVARPDAKVKLTCVGDGGVGKTCLLIVYSQKRFPTDYIPTVFENYVLNKPYEGKIVEFALWDTAGQEEYDRLRPLSYPETHVLFVCFAVDYPVSLENVEDKWYPEVAHFCEDVPIILVATKTDLRADSTAVSLLKAQGRHPVTPEEGAAVAKRIGAKYAEVSAMTGRGVEEVFDLALREAMKGTSLIGRSIKRRKAKCTVL